MSQPPAWLPNRWMIRSAVRPYGPGLLSLALIGAVFVGMLPSARAAAAVPPFTDIAGHPFAGDIEWLRQAGITNGCSYGRFCPDTFVTRDEMASPLSPSL